MENVVIKASKRDVYGKKVGQLRREGKLPGVIYGHHMEPISIVMDAREACRSMVGLTPSSIVTIDVDGEKTFRSDSRTPAQLSEEHFHPRRFPGCGR